MVVCEGRSIALIPNQEALDRYSNGDYITPSLRY